MITALNRVETLLQGSDKALYLHQIVALTDMNETVAKNCIKQLAQMGQIEVIPTPGRWGARYAWLAAKPVPAKHEEPDAPLSSTGNDAVLPETVKPGPISPEPAEPVTRYAVAVPKRALRIVKSRARAEALALSAVRRGAKGAEVFELMPVGRARRDAAFQECV